MGNRITPKRLNELVNQEAVVTMERPDLEERPTGPITKGGTYFFIREYIIRDKTTLRRYCPPRKDRNSPKNRYGAVKRFTVDLS